MKVRIGYVSNSSSSSFCILGIKTPEHIEDEYDIKYYGDILTYEYGIYNYYNQYFIGAKPSCMKDNETLLEFKQRICEALKKNNIDVKPEDLQWFTDGGYEG